MITLNLSSNIKDVLGFTDRLSKQFSFAVASALTATAKQVQAAMPAEMDKDLGRPTPFTKAGLYTKPARKDTLVAEVGFKPRQALYLSYQIEGGVRQPAGKALRLPANVELNQFGNMPAGLVKQLVTRAKAGKRATKSQARRFGVSQGLDLFYGEPGDGRPAGIYKRIDRGGDKNTLLPIVVFPKRAARYSKRFDFYEQARRVASANFDRNLTRSWEMALKSAR
jgi:hypothetical protein